MKKQFVSIIAASLMASGVSQVCANPGLFLGALAAVAGAAHYRGTQTRDHKEQQESLTRMFNNNVLPNALDIMPCENAAEADGAPCIVVQTIKINDTWTWKAFYLTYEQLVSSIWPSQQLKSEDLEKQLIFQQPVTPSWYGERYDAYITRFNEARATLIENAKTMVNDLMQRSGFSIDDQNSQPQ